MQTEALRIEGFLDSPELTAIRLSLNFLFANVDNQLGRALYLRAILPFLPTHPCKLCRKFPATTYYDLWEAGRLPASILRAMAATLISARLRYSAKSMRSAPIALNSCNARRASA